MFRTHQLRRLQSILDPFDEDPVSSLLAFVGEDDDPDEDQDDSDDGDDEEDDEAEDGEEDSGKKTSKKPSARSGGRRKSQKSEDDADDGADEAKDDDRKSPEYVKARLERDRRARARKAGFDSYEEFEAAAKAHRQNVEKNQTETQRLTNENKRLSKQLREKDAETRELKLDLAVTRTLTTEYPDLAGHEEWIMPRLMQEIEDDDWDDDRTLGRIVKSVVRDYAEKHGLGEGGTAGKTSKRNGSDLGTGRTPQRTRGGAPNAVRAAAEAEGKKLAGQMKQFRWA